MRSNHQPQKNKKNRIIEAAAHVFAQKGYAGASMADIALKACLLYTSDAADDLA